MQIQLFLTDDDIVNLKIQINNLIRSIYLSKYILLLPQQQTMHIKYILLLWSFLWY